MKRILIIALVVLMAAVMAACGGPEQPQKESDNEGGWGDNDDNDLNAAQENMVENIMEDMIENASDGEVDIDIDDGGDSVTISSEDGDVVIEGDEDSMTISSEDGEMVIQGDEDGMPWPGDKLPNYVPEVMGVKVIGTVDMPGGVQVMFEGCSMDAAEAYIGTLEAAGWNEFSSMDMEGVHTVQFQKGDEMLMFNWEEEDVEFGALQYIEG